MDISCLESGFRVPIDPSLHFREDNYQTLYIVVERSQFVFGANCAQIAKPVRSSRGLETVRFPRNS